MRAFKFRVWDTKQKRMGTVDQLGWKDSYIYARSSTIQSFVIVEAPADRFHELDGIMMQYTGFKDKNGNEIYEGDILHCPTLKDESNPKCIYGVKFEEGVFFVGKYILQHALMDYLSYHRQESVVLGNIYENPELI